MFQMLHYTVYNDTTIDVRFFFHFPRHCTIMFGNLFTGTLGELCDIFKKFKQVVICMAVARALQCVLHLLSYHQSLLRK